MIVPVTLAPSALPICRNMLTEALAIPPSVCGTLITAAAIDDGSAKPQPTPSTPSRTAVARLEVWGVCCVVSPVATAISSRPKLTVSLKPYRRARRPAGQLVIT